MAESAYTTKENGALYMQPNGVNTPLVWLKCYNVDDFDDPQGGVNILYCFDANGEYKPAGFTQDPPDTLTVSLGTYTGSKKEYLEKASAKCPMPLYMLLRCGGRADSLDNVVRTEIVNSLRITSRGYNGRVRMSEDVEAMSTFEISAYPNVQVVTKYTGSEQSVTDVAINNVVFSGELVCPGTCKPSGTPCEHGFLAADADTGVTANVHYSADGLTWAATGSDPFAADEDIKGAFAFAYGSNSRRVIVARGTTDAGNPAEVAYSDDNGATWTTANVGSTNGQYTVSQHALFGLDRWNIWVGTSGGYIYKSEDAGESWTVQHAGTVTTNGIVSIHMENELVGVAVTNTDDTVLITTDGGANWTAGTAVGTGAASTDVGFSGAYWWVANNGNLYYAENPTINLPTTWSLRSGFAGSGAGAIHAIQFYDQYVGFMALAVGGAASLLFTWDGGYNWFPITIPPAVKINDISICDLDTIYIAGEKSGGNGYIARVTSA